MIKRQRIRIFWLIFLAFLVVIFLFFKVVPFGKITYQYKWPRNFASGKGFLSDFKPGERLDVLAKKSLKIVADPVYFSLFTPRRFDQASVTIKYRQQLSSNTPIIELGVLKDKTSSNYELRPLENRLLEELRFSWNRLLEDGQRLILQSEPVYQDPVDFLNDLRSDQLKNCVGKSNSCVAVYNYNLDPKFTLPNYRELPIIINQPLRGAHQFYVYFTGGAWRLNFNFVDLNQDKEQDPIKVTLSSGQNIVASDSVADNNPSPVDGREENKSLTLQGQLLPAGVYKAEIKVSDDIVIKNIQSSSAKLVFINRIWPVSSVTMPLKIKTDGSYLQVHTLNPASLGKIFFGNYLLNITEAYHQFSTPTAADYAISEVKLSKDDIILENNGVFAFSADSFFSPDVKKIDRNFKAGEQIKYIVANYASPSSDNGWQVATVEFDLRDASRENGQYTFLFSIPGLSLADGETSTSTKNYLEISEIKIKLQGKTLWQKIRGR